MLHAPGAEAYPGQFPTRIGRAMVSSLLRRDRAGAIRSLFRARDHQDHKGVTLDVRRIFYYPAFMIVSFRDKETAPSRRENVSKPSRASNAPPV